ncbi:hypothetical protein KNV00_gp185 [Streptomyces phage Bmoc]|uniref:Uncharacterized protein n=1 Tax=Streptomyces phage Bmoc TaxID=2725629 RepID=A0A6M3TAR2_9CAUD|nr:hypothetical protein KNV00_gp185 [Streptomyces phage Bmoc]QJD50834.1 hypothetical protein SEA_BMOC_85 [Streptomyces phage Bmoc]
MSEPTPLEIISKIGEFQELHEFMDDPELDEALAILVQVMVNPNLKPETNQRLIVQLQAYAAKFSMLAAMYTTIKKAPAGSPNNFKKNIYYTTAESLDKLVQALKYTFKLPY